MEELLEVPRLEDQVRPEATLLEALVTTEEELQLPEVVVELGAVTGSPEDRRELEEEDYTKCRTKNSMRTETETSPQIKTTRIFKFGQSRRK